MRGLKIAIGAWLAMALGGCDEPRDIYQRPPPEIHELLRTVEVPLYMFGSSADTRSTVDSSDPSKVVWKISADDSPLMKFTATLVPEGERGTRVIIDIAGSRSTRFGDVEVNLAKAREIRDLYLVSMTEAIDSTLDGRAFDMSATYGAMMSAAAANANRLFPPSSVRTGERSTETAVNSQ